ncbi:GNAT family N-acetyltransferase [Paenibacillus oryzisoli]|uniref:GNAT family N-acetyltransferase n=1 Tax=Paenibacillus oryzisoli TaxID=1850517 RepID=UPI003D2A0AD2
MSEQKQFPQVSIEPWSPAGLNLLHLLNAPDMMEHLGGPETEDQLVSRHERYLTLTERRAGCMFSVVSLPDGQVVGSVGYWNSKWQEEDIYEMGWGILPAFQGKGFATAAVREAIALAKAATDDGADSDASKQIKFIHAFPSIDNPASNAVCRKLGFTLMHPCSFEYPPGHFMQCNNWRLGI